MPPPDVLEYAVEFWLLVAVGTLVIVFLLAWGISWLFWHIQVPRMMQITLEKLKAIMEEEER